MFVNYVLTNKYKLTLHRKYFLFNCILQIFHLHAMQINCVTQNYNFNKSRYLRKNKEKSIMTEIIPIKT